MTTSRERAFEQSTQHESADKRTVILVSLPVKPEARETFRKMLSEIGEHIAKEPSFVSALIHEDMDDPDTIVLYETWSGSREQLLEQLTRPYRRAYEAALPAMLKSERRIVFLHPPFASLSRA
jgi:quinol monooxygenase YgiN